MSFWTWVTLCVVYAAALGGCIAATLYAFHRLARRDSNGDMRGPLERSRKLTEFRRDHLVNHTVVAIVNGSIVGAMLVWQYGLGEPGSWPTAAYSFNGGVVAMATLTPLGLYVAERVSYRRAAKQMAREITGGAR